MQFVNQTRAQILPDRRDAAAKADVAVTRRGSGLLQRGVNAVRHKAELRIALHPERRARVVRQHEDGRLIRRLLPPPAPPTVVRPGSPDGTEHVLAEKPGSDAGEALLRDRVVDARFAVGLSLHPPPHTRVKEPVHQFRTIDPERMLKVLARPGTIAVE